MAAANEHRPPPRRFDVMIGTGGIGWGRFFALSGDHTLGREESRMGSYLDRRDYCKLHIISHYVKVLSAGRMRVVPVGKVGDDQQGARLIDEMRNAGLDVTHVGVEHGRPTLQSLCLVYPDGSGGNITTENSASAAVDPAAVRLAEPEFAAAGRRGLALAAPEVPLDARRELLELAGRYGLFRAASFVAGEVDSARRQGLLSHVDLLSINAGEAAALCGEAMDSADGAAIALQAARVLRRHNPSAVLALTCGAGGSWTCDGGQPHHQPTWKVPVASTAGAGDAFLAGMIAGLAAGLTVVDAQQLATLSAAASVTSPHTIHDGISCRMLADFARQLRADLQPSVLHYLEALS